MHNLNPLIPQQQKHEATMLKMYTPERTGIHLTLATAVWHASYFEPYKMAIPQLLKEGADANCLYLCSDLDVAQQLLDHGADINKGCRLGMTFLHRNMDNARLVKFALERKANLYCKNKEGLTPFAYLQKGESLEQFSRMCQGELGSILACHFSNDGQKEFFLFLLERMDVTALDANKLTPKACLHCLIWINELVLQTQRPEWLTDKSLDVLNLFIDALIDRIYPKLNSAMNLLVQEPVFPLIKKAFFCDKALGLPEALNQLITLYEKNLLSEKLALKIESLSNKMGLFFVLHEKFPIKPYVLSSKELDTLQQLINPIHEALMSLNSDFEKTSDVWNRNRVLERYSEIERFPTRDKINQIKKAGDWLHLSFCANKSVQGKVRIQQDLACSFSL